jgi:hypothetical protein
MEKQLEWRENSSKKQFPEPPSFYKGGRGKGGMRELGWGNWWKILSAPGSSDGGMPNGRGMSGADANRIRSISDSWIRLVLARRFWNQILTCVSVSLSWLENSARSEMERYCFSRNFFSSEFSCCVVKGVLGLRLGLCFRRVHLSGPVGALKPRPERKRW